MVSIKDEGIKNPEKFTFPLEIIREICEKEIAFILKKIDQNLDTFTEKFPASASVNLIYPAIDNQDWTSSFWTGMLWLAYEVTGDPKYRAVAEIQLESYKKRIDQRINIDTHDLGFLYTLSCVAAYKLTGNEDAKQTALRAADLLIERYFEKAGIIQAWGDLRNPTQRGRMIIDCCMNLPLLYWAAEVNGNPKYFNAAKSHAQQAVNYIIREDSSTFHTFYMDVESGAPKFGQTHQGYADESCWSRGQAWGIYGFPLSYIYTKDPGVIEVTTKLTNYFLNRLPEDLICYWDLIFTQGNEQERDSSGAAIAVCGMLELVKHLPISHVNKSVYENAAFSILKSLADSYTTKGLQSNGVLIHAVYNKPRGMGIDECNIWGDYFYFEAWVRLLKDWKLYW